MNFSQSLLNTLTIAPFYFSPNLGRGEQFESLWGAAFGISDGEGGRRGWKMPPNKKAMVSNAFVRLVAVNLNLPWPFVWPEWAIREEFRQGVCADETEFSYILCKNVFCGQVCAVYLHSQMDNGPVIHSNWNQNPVILTLVTEVTLRITF